MNNTNSQAQQISGIALILLGVAMVIGGFVFWVTLSGKAERQGGVYIPGFVPIILIFAGGPLIASGFHMVRGAGHGSKTPKTRVAESGIKVFLEADSRTALIATLTADDAVRLGETKEVQGISWVGVTLADDRSGYMYSDSKVWRTLDATTIAPETPVYRLSEKVDDLLTTLPPQSKLEICRDDWDGGMFKIKVWLPDGKKGFIKLRTKVTWD